MTQIDHEEDVAFARTGIVSPTGPLTEPLKTFVDFETTEIFRRKCNEAGMDVSSAMRDWVFSVSHGETFTKKVADAQKVKHQKLFGTGANADLIEAKQ